MSEFMEEYEPLRIPFESIVAATNNFDVGNFLGEGGFGKVYKGEFTHSHKGWSVGAVKRLHVADISFGREIMFLSRLKHENIISLLGICDEKKERILVYEYACNNSLDCHLRDPNLRWIQRLKICLGAARGLEYLHDYKDTHQRVLHRDVKSANILLDENWTAKIADFGLSKYGPANQKHTYVFSDAKGSLGYIDPLYMETGLLTKESDVYSFGVVLFEVLCSRHCIDFNYFDERRSLPILVKKCYKEHTLNTVVDDTLRQQFDDKSFNTFVSIAYQCLEKKRTKRPSMASVVSKLKIALEAQEAFELKALEAKKKTIGNPLLDYQNICPPGGSNLVVLYTTGAKSIRKTFKDCSRIRFLLKGKVLYQERDVSMHPDFNDELWKILGKKVGLPRLFIKGRYIGGAEEVLRLNEQGKFRPLLAGIPLTKSDVACKVCAGNWFVVCSNCRGSTRLPKTCAQCNQNGLTKCTVCF